MKKCGTCKIDKLISAFGKNKNGKNGLRSACKECSRESCKNYHSKNKEKIALLKREWDRNNPNGRRNLSLKNKFGITVEIYDQMLKSQENKCAICLKAPETQNKRLAVDHCHETAKIRGLLCDDCNRALGLFHDNEQSLNKAIEYLRK